jgi:hypothetical protein
MDYDRDKVDEVVLALMYLTLTKDKRGFRSWKGQDWETLDRLHEKGYIGNPKTKARSVALSDEAVELSEKLFRKHFGKLTP